MEKTEPFRYNVGKKGTAKYNRKSPKGQRPTPVNPCGICDSSCNHLGSKWFGYPHSSSSAANVPILCTSFPPPVLSISLQVRSFKDGHPRSWNPQHPEISMATWTSSSKTQIMASQGILSEILI